ncbi:Flp pilus assembly protein CpaB [Paenibacillus alvei]|uniref:Flp pilus assembly protein CpaB n=1 Tax=Paenibacillus alvei TaxID=44250 RepID=A0ABT4H8H4_PAEAL|nr:RcpC/CpaB family pilus assembly protein [Paenibacillus alvei]EJW14340.1 Flp pilus assembly protein CpaB [Paenibacillus alvei DSM 29]MCY9542844.1 Flp pilus assembly protein CpaB [Paenibacillus alvei]MCY9736101.1 Flp pilus assembly protein CpaB [Paenibacillus alvei]MCY9757354.1 Flp pilus assembly protein CpaB [Paenibacillus alvei]MCY9764907.1 Flp pilus assembly protein CpaB [Paenibacillus alvei]
MKRFWNKYTRAAIITLTGILLGIVVVLINKSEINSQVHTERVIVLKEDITPFGKVSKEQLEYQEITISSIPDDAVRDAEELNFDNLYASEYGLIKGSPLRKGYLTTQEQSKLGTAVGLKDGMVEIGVTTTLAQSAGDGIKSGVYVDAIAFVHDDRTGTGKTVEDPKLRKLLIKKRLNSEGTEPNTGTGNSLIPIVAVLEVNKEQAKALMEYQETGKVYLLPSGYTSKD